MPTTDLLAALRDGSLPPAQFTHANHVKAAWMMLRQRPLHEAAPEFSALLRAYVRLVGAEDKFHLTLTYAFLHLIHQHMTASPDNWVAFQARNRDLFEDAKTLIGRHYSAELLATAEARQRFIEPDRLPLPCPAQDAAKR